jgi:hypothetical protein
MAMTVSVLQVDRWADVGLGLIGGAFAGLSGGDNEACAGNYAGKQSTTAEPAFFIE